jgi:hypothetical protein
MEGVMSVLANPRHAVGVATVLLALAATPTSAARADWSQNLSEFLPAIQTCVRHEPEAASVVTVAREVGTHLVDVRLRGPDGARWDCITAGSGQRVERLVRVTGNQLQANEDAPIFTPLRHGRPRGGCFRHEAARDGDGHLVGWLSYPSC